MISPNARDAGLSFITITGFSPLGDEGNNPQNSVTNVYQVLDNASYVHGNHLIRIPELTFASRSRNAFRDVESRGRLQFSPFGQVTFNALGDCCSAFPCLPAWPASITQQLPHAQLQFLANDSFRVSRG